MTLKKVLILAPIAMLSLASCGKRGVRHETSDYFLTAKSPYHNNYHILQLSDLHLGTNCDRKVQYAFLQKTIDKARDYAGSIDMIVITGDLFTFGTKEIVKEFCNFMEKQKIEWTLTFGNHDEQCYFSVDWLTGYFNELSEKKDSFLLFKDYQDDDVFGNANFVISIKKEVGSAEDDERLYIFDSNRYRYEIGNYGYDYIHHDQIDWYERCTRYGETNNGPIDPESIHSLAFFHIPLLEFATYYEEAKKESGLADFVVADDGSLLDRKKDGVSAAKQNTGLYSKMMELGSTKGIFVGHDHLNNYAVRVKGDDGITLSYGVKATDTINADEDLVGGQVITLHDNEGKRKISIQPILHKYSDLEVK